MLTNWVAKAANALQDEWDIGPGARVRLALPPHWRLVYWAYAVWSAGGVVVLAGADDWAAGAEVTVSDDPAVLGAVDGDGVLVTLAALARRSPTRSRPARSTRRPRSRRTPTGSTRMPARPPPISRSPT